ncbi:DUF4132 domain-containing protein [Streptomyces sp. L-9-10]|uniref:WGR and DUF4132 domain-containing protein n=1 Tax=Streptomyces sp. L-9-10 TaxID=1478131 RepID=UPI00101DA00C|nr:DUF4132 domain-containing protein [Streptomyces sp. L-9-10]
MRRWEFDQGTSSKFWEAEASGTVVTVRYGRTGTRGQEQEKEFADATAAQAYLAKTIMQKERKGYQETTAGAPAATAPADAAPTAQRRPDEDTFRLPAAWRNTLYPRRGGVRRPPSAPDPKQDARTLTLLRDREHWTPATFSERTAPALVEAALAHLHGEPDPFGAAVIGTMATTVDVGLRAVVDAWAAAHGLPFAASGVMHLVGLEVAWVHQADPRLVRLRDELWDRSSALFWDADSPHKYDELRGRGNTVSSLAGPIHPSVAAVTGSARPLHGGLREALDRVRELLADCDDRTYDEAVARLSGHRDDFTHRIVVAYLVPTETGWVAGCFADCSANAAALAGEHGLRSLLRCLPHTAEQVATVAEHDQVPPDQAEFATVAEGAGAAVDALIIQGLQAWQHSRTSYRKPTELRRALLEVPTDRALSYFVEHVGEKDIRPYVVKAMERYPVRALRLLARAAASDGPGSAVHSLLVSHIGAHPELTTEHLPSLEAAAGEAVRAVLDDSGRLPDADATDLPGLLTSPPWTRPRRTVRPLTVTGLAAPEEPVEAWLPGEREEWAATPTDYVPWPWPQHMKYDKDRLRKGYLSNDVDRAGWYMELPEDRILPLLDGWAPTSFYSGQEVLRPFMAKFGLKAHTFLVRLAAREPQIAGHLLLPFLSAGIARMMADWLVRLKTSAATARSWLDRNGPRAAELLVPDAVGPAGPARRAAEAALLHIAARHGDTAVREAAVGHGPQAAAAIGQLMDYADPLTDTLPRTMPQVPDWADPRLLPQIAVRAGGALPPEATRHVVTMLALSTPGAHYPGLDVVEEICEPASLSEFAWSVFQRWRQAHMPAKQSWALTALGRLGDDETVRRLTPVIRAWPGESAHRRAVDGLDVLAEIGSDVALTHLHGIAQRVKFTGLKEHARKKIGAVAEGLGLTADQLADRLVPDLGLGPDGTTVIDYGTRRFTVGFDELLRPYVLDGAGKRRKDLPKPGAADDTGLATAERKRFGALKKDVRTVAADRIQRLETAMVQGGTWTAAEFRDLFAHHPLMRHPARRLVWSSAHEAGAHTFRVAEDGTLADHADDTFVLPDDATVRIPHPLHLGDALAAWREVFADYEILQPFRQLARPVLRLTPEEAAGSSLPRFERATVVTGALLGLTKRGWQRMDVLDAGGFGGVYKVCGPNQVVSVAPEDGFNINDLDYAAPVRLSSVWIGTHWYPNHRGEVRFGGIDPLAASELLLDLTDVLEENPG